MTSTKTSMHLFILGATGGIGRQLVDQALERHHQVTSFVRSPQKLGAAGGGLTLIQGDVHNADAMTRCTTSHRWVCVPSHRDGRCVAQSCGRPAS
jgi:putative NADH-flavin reductase